MTSDIRYRLRELHRLFISECERNAIDNAMDALLAIDKEARAARVLDDPDAPTVRPEVRTDYWRQIYKNVHNNPRLAMTVLDKWRRDGGAK